MKSAKSGFSLIEILLVIGIMGFLMTLILISVSNARRDSRDNKRLVDIQSMQKALELYWQQYGAYPVVGGESGEVQNWSELSETLSLYILTALPVDPFNRDISIYSYVSKNDGKAYYLSAVLENDTHNALNQDVDDSGIGGTGWAMVSSTNSTFTGDVTINCDGPVYCLSDINR